LTPKNVWILTAAALLVALALTAGCGGSKSITQMTAHELFEKGKQKYEKGKYYSAIENLQACIYNYPGKTIVDTAQYYLALTYFANKEYEVAQVEFNRLAINYPGSVYFEQSIFMRAACYFHSSSTHYGLDQESLLTAIDLLEDFIIDFPESEAVPDAHEYLTAARTRLARKTYEGGVVYSRMNANEAAKIYFQEVIDEYTDTEYGARATYMYAEREFKMGNYGQARERFEGFLTAFPDHEWAAKASELLLESAYREAEEAFKTDLYGDGTRATLTAFQADFPDSKYAEKVANYLRQLPPEQTDTAQVENAGS